MRLGRPGQSTERACEKGIEGLILACVFVVWLFSARFCGSWLVERIIAGVDVLHGRTGYLW
ncbi:hypothetical protein BDY21DRAFT_333949 [Lineolata rhizophorae]|uniref:Uncharacterized protein n=1 Tax=Lineolata rhizophorae TaxID=578093 RepID=A0A6A6PAN0_9PEZI|nr:hypothetical protein BDY21DRAFT_333949 [Lineolata rhizophorae]